MRTVRVAVKGYIDLAVWDTDDPNEAEGRAEFALLSELYSWLCSLRDSFSCVGSDEGVTVDDWSFTEGIEAHVWDAPLGPGRGSDA